jgi:4-hydroxy-tetrahydrodipicolinate reductase
MIRIAIAGAAGRMGGALIAALPDHPGLRLTAAFERAGSHEIGRTVTGGGAAVVVRPFSQDVLGEVDVLVDFTHPEATLAHVAGCVVMGKRLVIGTTGFDESGLDALRAASRHVAIVHAPNMSPGVNLCFQLVGLAARALGTDADIEVIEAHHRQKKDAPSGTALRLGEVAASARGQSLGEHARHGRQGPAAGPRPAGEIGFSAIRAGDIVGDHTVLFALPGERIEITHRASSRDNFARGALLAAGWVMGRSTGFFDMQDVLGLR